MSKSKKLSVIFCAILLFGTFFLTRFFRHRYVVPIIMYHSIVARPTPENRLTVSAKTFDAQMHFLKSHHYHVLPLERLAELIRDKKGIPAKAIAITFDDGYVDNYTLAFPVLKRYNLPATIFIIVNEVGRAQKDRLSWGQIKEMQGSGLVTIGSHALGPDPLFKAKSEGDLRNEIFESKRMLERELGRDVGLFSYPEGMFDQKIRHLVKEAGYAAAVATNPGSESPSDDVFALKRIRISENASNMFVFRVETSGFYTFMKEYKKRKNAKE